MDKKSLCGDNSCVYWLWYCKTGHIPVNYDAVPIEESSELSSSKIGRSPIEGNTEVIEEIKESSTPYSIENEPNE
jgi:hypothetical protein